MQQIYIYMDDSGILHTNDKYFILGGIVYLSTIEKNTLEKKYVNLISNIKTKYSSYEKKYNNMRFKDKNILINKFNDYITFGIIVKTNNIYKNIMINKMSRGRFRDYSIRIIIKEIIKYLINKKNIKSIDIICLNIFIDENNMKSNTNRLLKNDIFNELKIGVKNTKYNVFYRPILNGKLIINLNFVKSHNNISIQISDIISGSIRSSILYKTTLNVNILKFIP